MCLFPSEGTQCEHPRCEHRVYRDPPFRRPHSSVERLQYSSFKNRPHSRKIMRLIEGRKPEETSGVTHEAGPVVRNDTGSTRKESILIDQSVNSISTDASGNQTNFALSIASVRPVYGAHHLEMMNNEKDDKNENEKKDDRYDDMKKLRKNNGKTYEERIDKIMKKQIDMLTRQAQRLADEKKRKQRRKKHKNKKKKHSKTSKKKNNTKTEKRAKP